MKYLDFPEILALSNALHRRRAGPLVVDGRVEAYSFKPTANAKKFEKEILSPWENGGRDGAGLDRPLKGETNVSLDASSDPSPPLLGGSNQAASNDLEIILPEPLLRRGASFDSTMSHHSSTGGSSSAVTASASLGNGFDLLDDEGGSIPAPPAPQRGVGQANTPDSSMVKGSNGSRSASPHPPPAPGGSPQHGRPQVPPPLCLLRGHPQLRLPASTDSPYVSGRASSSPY